MNEFNTAISKIGVVPVIKLNNPARDALPLADALIAGGLPVAEVTFRAEGAASAIYAMRDAHPDMYVGAGTVLTVKQAEEAKSAGSSFIVSPGFSPKLADACERMSIPYLPGCTTATEYQAALEYGFEILKFFPAEQSGGLARIKALSAPFPMFKIMPTGGINLSNLESYLSCPVIAACGGSYMVTSQLIDGGKWGEITDLCRRSVEIRDKVRG